MGITSLPLQSNVHTPGCNRNRVRTLSITFYSFLCMHFVLNSSLQQFSLSVTQPLLPLCFCPYCSFSCKIPLSPPLKSYILLQELAMSPFLKMLPASIFFTSEISVTYCILSLLLSMSDLGKLAPSLH